MMKAALVFGVAAAYEEEWAAFQQAQGERNGEIPEAFKQNVDAAKAHNAVNSDYKMGWTGPFAAMSQEEYATVLGFKKADWGAVPHLGQHVASEVTANSVDWTTKGAVNPVKNQGQCGSCWAFSTIGAVESAWEIAGNDLTSMSEQQLVDCDKVDSGCQGGLMDNGFTYLEKNPTCTESSYPYKGADGSCQQSSCDTAIPKGSVTGYHDVASETALVSAVEQQPVSVAIEADQQGFQLYESGVFSGTCGTQLDHGVIAVGYGTDSGTAYWKVRNSWGASWGDAGYIRMARGVNQCGIAESASYPTVSGASVTV